MRLMICVSVFLAAIGVAAAAGAEKPPEPVEVINFPELQQVSGVVSVDNFPRVQKVEVVNPVGGGVDNLVVDLLDSRVALPNIGDFWISPTFDASAYNRIGLRVSNDAQGLTQDTVHCFFEWQWDTEGFAAVRSSASPSFALTNSAPTTVTGLTDVAGIEARVVCRVPSQTINDGGFLDDVKVLLRRE